ESSRQRGTERRSAHNTSKETGFETDDGRARQITSGGKKRRAADRRCGTRRSVDWSRIIKCDDGPRTRGRSSFEGTSGHQRRRVELIREPVNDRGIQPHDVLSTVLDLWSGGAVGVQMMWFEVAVDNPAR